MRDLGIKEFRDLGIVNLGIEGFRDFGLRIGDCGLGTY